ncbi:ferredoxin reductase domain-containing protein [Pseudaminobacter sp. NGMCC 1.201702]|uniref:hypothetical protein n=1 Tax=Pseudaminobacter sp. NGMCC 1.201702 TaxID=3391825 RepID=UPI0039EFCCC7
MTLACTAGPVPDDTRARLRGPLLKTYSISCDVAEPRQYRITVKREATPGLGLPDGIGSCWLHDSVQEEDEIEIAAPRGSFVLDEDRSRLVLLLAGASD